VGIAQPPLAGPAPPNQPEFVLQVGKEDVMEAPGLHDQPFFKQHLLYLNSLYNSLDNSQNCLTYSNSNNSYFTTIFSMGSFGITNLS